jgi:hypothetical protein
VEYQEIRVMPISVGIALKLTVVSMASAIAGSASVLIHIQGCNASYPQQTWVKWVLGEPSATVMMLDHIPKEALEASSLSRVTSKMTLAMQVAKVI